MKKSLAVLSTITVAAILPASAMAATTVNISNNGGDTSANVNVQNSFNSSTTSTNTTTSHTKVRIETNGEVKEYESNNGEDIHVESSDGSSKVNISNKGTLTKEEKEEIEMEKKEATEEAKKATEKAKKKVETVKEHQKDFFRKLEEWIKDFFHNLF